MNLKEGEEEVFENSISYWKSVISNGGDKEEAIRNVDRIAESTFEKKEQNDLFYYELIDFYNCVKNKKNVLEISKRAVQEGKINNHSYEIGLLLYFNLKEVINQGISDTDLKKCINLKQNIGLEEDTDPNENVDEKDNLIYEGIKEMSKVFEAVVKIVVQTYLIEGYKLSENEDRFMLFNYFNEFYFVENPDWNKIFEMAIYIKDEVKDKEFVNDYFCVLLAELDAIGCCDTEEFFSDILRIAEYVDKDWRDDENYYAPLSSICEQYGESKTIDVRIIDKIFNEVKEAKIWNGDIYLSLEKAVSTQKTLEGMQELLKIHEYIYNNKNLSCYSKECAHLASQCYEWFLEKNLYTNGEPLNPEDRKKFFELKKYYDYQQSVSDDCFFIERIKECISFGDEKNIMPSIYEAYQLGLTSPELYKLALDFYKEVGSSAEKFIECKKLVKYDKYLKLAEKIELLGLPENYFNYYEEEDEEEFEELSERLEGFDEELDSSFASSSRSSLNKK